MSLFVFLNKCICLTFKQKKKNYRLLFYNCMWLGPGRRLIKYKYYKAKKIPLSALICIFLRMIFLFFFFQTCILYITTTLIQFSYAVKNVEFCILYFIPFIIIVYRAAAAADRSIAYCRNNNMDDLFVCCIINVFIYETHSYNDDCLLFVVYMI